MYKIADFSWNIEATDASFLRFSFPSIRFSAIDFSHIIHMTSLLGEAVCLVVNLNTFSDLQTLSLTIEDDLVGFVLLLNQDFSH